MKFEELFFQNGNKNIDRAFSNFIDERLDDCIKELKKNNGNYLKSAKANKELCAKLQDIAGDDNTRETVNAYLASSFDMSAAEQPSIYAQGFRDAISLMQSLGLLKG